MNFAEVTPQIMLYIAVLEPEVCFIRKFISIKSVSPKSV